MSKRQGKGTERGRILADLRNGSRSARHVVKSRKGTRATRKADAVADSRG